MRRAWSPLVASSLFEAVSSALGVVILLRVSPALAACDNTTPASGQTVTCSSTTSPNPSSTPVAATACSTNVSVNVLLGAELTISGNNGILVYDRSTVTNLGSISVSGDTFDGISAQGTGAGQNVLINRGTIVTTGSESEGLFNGAAAVTMLNDTGGVIQTSGSNSVAMHDFASPGGGTLTNKGLLSTSGDGSAGMAAETVNDTIVNSGTIMTTGVGSPGMFANGIEVGGIGNNVITNNGTIDVSGAGSHGIVSNDPSPGVITNTGSITASGSGGLGAFVAGNVTLINAAGASIVSKQSNGIDANGGGTFTNAGTISGEDVAISIANGSATINNSGTIEAAATEAISSSGAYDIVINNTGTIEGGNGRAIYTDTGNDTLNWSAGTIIGFVRLGTGHDTATLTGLTDTNLAGVPLLAGGNVSSVLNFDDTQASGLSRFTNWSTINATNGSQLTLDNNGLTLGNSGTLTGTLSIDSTSTLFAGGLGDPAITAAVSGQLVTVSNAGTINLTNGGAGTNDALVVNGNYVGLNGKLLLQSVLNGDGSPSDKLVIVQGTGSGKTTLGITNVGGIGAATVTDGIMVVQASDGATTTAGAFTLPKPLIAGAYTYYLFKGGVSAGTADNWYLRSSLAATPTPTPTPTPTGPLAAGGTPPLPSAPRAGSAPTPLYRMEAPVYAEVPELARALGLEQIGTFHDREGSQSLLTETGALPASWTRVWGGQATLSNGGAVDPEFSGTLGGITLGQDLYANATPGGQRNHYGFILGFARAQGDVSGFALGFPNLAAGHLSINAYSAGGYWTHVGPGGWYTDAVLLGSSLTISPMSYENIGASTHGYAEAASFEAGMPIPLPANLRIEPQAQLIWQHTSIDDLDDGISSVSFHAANGLVGRLGLRLEEKFEGAGAVWEPYLRANLWRYFNGTDEVTFGGTTVIPTSVPATAAEFGVGIAARLSAHGSVYAAAGYTTNVNGAHRSVFEGNAGVRWSW
jgi:outer membrane autotransporter protein